MSSGWSCLITGWVCSFLRVADMREGCKGWGWCKFVARNESRDILPQVTQYSRRLLYVYAVCWSVMTRGRHCWWVIHTVLLSNCYLNTKHYVNVIFNFECPDMSLEFKHRISLQNTIYSVYCLQYYFVKQLVRSWLSQLERWHRLCVERNVTGSSLGIYQIFLSVPFILHCAGTFYYSVCQFVAQVVGS